MPILPGGTHPDKLDQRLLAAIGRRALPSPSKMPKSHSAAVAFLYLYMTLTHGGLNKRFVIDPTPSTPMPLRTPYASTSPSIFNLGSDLT